MEDELIKDLNDLLEIFFKHTDGYAKASDSTEDKELQRVLKSISDHKESSALEIRNIIKKNSFDIDDEHVGLVRNLNKVLNPNLNFNDNKSIIETCLIRETSLKNKLGLILNKNYNNIRLKITLENNISQCIAVKSVLWEQSGRFN